MLARGEGVDRRETREGGSSVWRLCTWKKPGVHFVKLTKRISKKQKPLTGNF